MYPRRESTNGRPVPRREFIGLGTVVALGAVAASCGGSGSPTIKGTSGDVQLAKRFPKDALVPGTVRLPVSLLDESGVLGNDSKVSLPDSLTARVTNSDTGEVVASGIVARRHGAALAVPYWPIEVEIDAPGVYILTVDEAPKADAAFQVFDRSAVPMPLVGDALPPFDTPTVANARGVDPICTRPEGTCPFHDVTLAEALSSGKPVVYLIGTPAYCTTGTCAPALEALMAVATEKADSMVFVHADVYSDKTATTPAPAVQAYKLSYEPVLYITDATGTLVRRLDVVFDEEELSSVLG